MCFYVLMEAHQGLLQRLREAESVFSEGQNVLSLETKQKIT